MGVASGITCLVDGVPSMSGWWVQDTNLAPEFSSSDTPGAMARETGNSDWKGAYRAYGHTPVHFPGEAIDFKGDITDVPKGVNGTGIINRITVTCPIEEGKLIDTVVEFSGNGALAHTTGNATKGADPKIFSAIIRKIKWANSDVAVRNWRLVMSARNRPYVDTDTAGLVLRNAGNVDAQFEYGLYEDDPADRPTKGDVQIIKFFVTASTSWDLTWGILQQVGPFRADHEGAENVAGIVRGSWTSQDGTSIGTLINPAGGTKWP